MPSQAAQGWDCRSAGRPTQAPDLYQTPNFFGARPGDLGSLAAAAAAVAAQQAREHTAAASAASAAAMQWANAAVQQAGYARELDVQSLISFLGAMQLCQKSGLASPMLPSNLGCIGSFGAGSMVPGAVASSQISPFASAKSAASPVEMWHTTPSNAAPSVITEDRASKKWVV